MEVIQRRGEKRGLVGAWDHSSCSRPAAGGMMQISWAGAWGQPGPGEERDFPLLSVLVGGILTSPKGQPGEEHVGLALGFIWGRMEQEAPLKSETASSRSSCRTGRCVWGEVSIPGQFERTSGNWEDADLIRSGRMWWALVYNNPPSPHSLWPVAM